MHINVLITRVHAPRVLRRLRRHADGSALRRRLSCALLAAELLPAVFAADVAHAARRVDFASYCPAALWPGVDVFDDPHRWGRAGIKAVPHLRLRFGPSKAPPANTPLLSVQPQVPARRPGVQP